MEIKVEGTRLIDKLTNNMTRSEFESLVGGF